MRSVPMIFPGQASQVVGMAADLADRDGAGGRFLARVDEILDFPLTNIMFAGPAERLTETKNAQPAILAHSVAVMLDLREQGVTPSLVAGHSLGEYSAAVAAGAIMPEDGLRAVRRRGELMFAAGERQPGTMAAVLGLTADAVAEVCAAIATEHGTVVVANHNSSVQVAISGEVAAVAAAGPALKEAGARRVVPLNVSGAFHSPLLAEAAGEFRDFLEGVAVSDSEVPLIANVSAEPVREAVRLREGLERQLTAPVRWHETMERICRPGAGSPPPVVLEVGPGKILANLARREFPGTTFVPVGTAEDIAALPEQLESIVEG